LGKHSIDKFITKFTSLLRYVPYIRDEKAKVQWFTNNLPTFMKEKLEFDNPKTMDEPIRKAQICCHQMKLKEDSTKT